MTLSHWARRLSLAALVIAVTAVLVALAVRNDNPPKIPPGVVAKLHISAGKPIAPGIYSKSFTFQNGSGKQRGYMITANLTVPGVSMAPVTGSTSAGRLTKRVKLSTIVSNRGAVGGVNADQFDTSTSLPIGGVMTNGVLYKTPFQARKVSTVYQLADGTVNVGPLNFSGVATVLTPIASVPPASSSSPAPTVSAPTAAQLTYPIASINTPADAAAGKLSLFTSALGPVGLPHCVTVTGSWSASSKQLTVWGLWANSTSFGGLSGTQESLVGCGAAGTWLSANMKLGSRIGISYSLMTPTGQPVTSMISSDGLLRANGQTYNDKSRIVDAGNNPVTAMCISADRKHVEFVVVDGREGKNARGLTIPQLSDLTAALSCYTAVVFDGGGSTDLVRKLPGKKAQVLNHPSDRTGERPIPAAMLLFYKKP